MKDTDKDGIDDGEEVSKGTNPIVKTDTDLDGMMSDDWEVLRGTRVNSDDARVDLDNDGIDNIIEFAHRTFPMDASSTPIVKIIYVDAVTGNDVTGNDSIANPYANFLIAIGVATAGDTIQFAVGTYSESNVLPFTKMVKVKGNVNRSVILNMTSMYFLALKWGGFEGLQLNVNGRFFMFNGRNVIFRNVELTMGAPLKMSKKTKVSFYNVLLKNAGTASAGITAEVIAGAAGNIRTELSINNSTIGGYPVGITWNNSTYLRIRNTILANTIDL